MNGVKTDGRGQVEAPMAGTRLPTAAPAAAVVDVQVGNGSKAEAVGWALGIAAIVIVAYALGFGLTSVSGWFSGAAGIWLLGLTSTVPAATIAAALAFAPGPRVQDEP